MGLYGREYTAAMTGSPKQSSITIHLVKIQDEEPEIAIPTNPVGRRSNRRPLSGEISASAVNIPGVDNSDIISFEIYTPSGFCMGIYSDEMDFIEALFSLSGEYEIRFMTDYAVFVGNVEI